MFHTCKERHGRRWFWHHGGYGATVELNWWSSFCHLGVEGDDEGWTIGVALTPLALWVSFRGIWTPAEPREFKLAIHSWTIWLTLWGHPHEWHRRDPWWRRGVSVNLPNVLLGRQRYTCAKVGDPVPVTITMPEGTYRAFFQEQLEVWTRPRGLHTTRRSYHVHIPKGIPFAGKGESAWDCDDDGLFGVSVEGSIEDGIERVRQIVLKRRRDYGEPSAESVTRSVEVL